MLRKTILALLSVLCVVTGLVTHSALAVPFEECVPSESDRIHREAVTGSEWRAFRLNLPTGGDLRIAIDNAGANGSQSMSGVWLFDTAGDIAMGGGGGGGGSQLFQLERSASPVGEIDVRAGGPSGGCRYVAGYGLPAGEYVLEVLISGDGESAHLLSLNGPIDAVVLGETMGQAIFRTLADFEGGTRNITYAGALGIDESSVDGASLQFEFSNSPIGYFWGFPNPFNGGEMEMSFDSPQGSHEDQSYDFHSVGDGPGSYDFRIDHAVNATVALAVADVIVP